MIRLERIGLSFADKQVFSGLNLQLPDQGVFVLRGPSGCGKTSLLRIIAGLLTPQEGRVTGLEGRRISLLFQEDRLIPWRSALQNVCLGMETQDAERARGLLEAMEIRETGGYPADLSGGMRRRVAIARALAHGGDLLLMDEPFTGIDGELKRRIAPQIKANAPLIIMTTHEEEDARLLGAEHIPIDWQL